MTSFRPTDLQITLNNTEITNSLKFSRPWTVPWLVVHLCADKLTLSSVVFLGTDAYLSTEYPGCGFPAFQNLERDGKSHWKRPAQCWQVLITPMYALFSSSVVLKLPVAEWFLEPIVSISKPSTRSKSQDRLNLHTLTSTNMKHEQNTIPSRIVAL